MHHMVLLVPQGLAMLTEQVWKWKAIQKLKKTKMSYIGMTEEDFDEELFAIGCVDYYGSANFGCPYPEPVESEKEVIDLLKLKGITLD